MKENSLIKNRYYEIDIDNKTYAYIRVKKDFYTEGVLIENKAILSGYFKWYRTFNAFILDNSLEKFEHDLDAISIESIEEKFIFDINGNTSSKEYNLYDADMDEYFYVFRKKLKYSNINIKIINDENVIKDIDFLIRNSIRNLNEICMWCYDSLQKHRYGNLKELIMERTYINS
ncbi:MAG: hypothetical protein IJ574_01160 [Bacilli bacterium]|nr:hypothetical protein [Bacilli bacterium]